MTNALRFIRYSVRVILAAHNRPRHAANPWPRRRQLLGAGLAGAVFLTLPAWMWMLGVI